MNKKPRISSTLIEEVVSEAAGEDTIPLVRILKNKKNVSEFKLAEELEKEVNEVRNMLYRLYHSNLVMSSRKKDKQKGWYIYYWTFKPNQIKHTYVQLKKKRLERLQERSSREKENFYFQCNNKCMRLDIEQTTHFEFKCPECGDLMYQQDNSIIINKIQEEIEEIQKELRINLPILETVKEEEIEEDIDEETEDKEVKKTTKKVVKKKAIKKTKKKITPKKKTILKKKPTPKKKTYIQKKAPVKKKTTIKTNTPNQTTETKPVMKATSKLKNVVKKITRKK